MPWSTLRRVCSKALSCLSYKKLGCVALTSSETLHESVFQFGLMVALPCAVIAALVKTLDQHGPDQAADFLKDVNLDEAYGAFTFFVGMITVFRTQQAYSRYWDGCDAAYMMMSDFFDVTSSLFSFTRVTKEPKEKVSGFQHTMIRLFSMLHALILRELEGQGDISGQLRTQAYELIDADGIDEESIELIRRTTHKVDLVFQWIQCGIVEAMDEGILSIPAPILTRAFQELNSGMMQFHKCLKIVQSPFPFPYTAAAELILVMHWAVTPIVASTWTGDIWSSALLAFFQTFILWSLHATASELENPFEQDMNDLNMLGMQRELNSRLLTLMEHTESRVPRLTEQATFDTHAISDALYGDSAMGDGIVNLHQLIDEKVIRPSWVTVRRSNSLQSDMGILPMGSDGNMRRASDGHMRRASGNGSIPRHHVGSAAPPVRSRASDGARGDSDQAAAAGGVESRGLNGSASPATWSRTLHGRQPKSRTDRGASQPSSASRQPSQPVTRSAVGRLSPRASPRPSSASPSPKHHHHLSVDTRRPPPSKQDSGRFSIGDAGSGTLGGGFSTLVSLDALPPESVLAASGSSAFFPPPRETHDGVPMEDEYTSY